MPRANRFFVANHAWHDDPGIYPPCHRHQLSESQLCYRLSMESSPIPHLRFEHASR